MSDKKEKKVTQPTNSTKVKPLILKTDKSELRALFAPEEDKKADKE